MPRSTRHKPSPQSDEAWDFLIDEAKEFYARASRWMIALFCIGTVSCTGGITCAFQTDQIWSGLALPLIAGGIAEMVFGYQCLRYTRRFTNISKLEMDIPGLVEDQRTCLARAQSFVQTLWNISIITLATGIILSVGAVLANANVRLTGLGAGLITHGAIMLTYALLSKYRIAIYQHALDKV